MKFIPEYPVSKLKPADYNPRKIEPQDFEKLKASIERFGMVKPIILNGNGVLTAGHQRTKANISLGRETVPAIVLKEISLHDEIKFNLFHNQAETSRNRTWISHPEELPLGYSWVSPERIGYDPDIKNGGYLKEITLLILKYGAWGSCIMNASGEIVQNCDYALAHKLNAGEPLLVYKMTDADAADLIEIMKGNFGSYHYDALGIQPYNQVLVQMFRLPEDKTKKTKKSQLYENFVIPNLTKDLRLFDFGAGRMEYVKRLREIGYKTFGYEPYYKERGQKGINVRAVVQHIVEIVTEIGNNGLYDVVVLDSVLNSITNTQYERYVLTACNALMNAEGVFYCGTRNLDHANMKMEYTKASHQSDKIFQFYDPDNFSATFRNGVWTMQKFHTHETLEALLSNYFHEVEIKPTIHTIYAIARKPRKLTIAEYVEALETEFNMIYPGEFKHNRHQKLVLVVLDNLKQRE